MSTPKKIGEFFKEKISGMFSSGLRSEKELESSLEWSNNDETVILKKCDYESMKNELFDQSQIIKKLKVRDQENKSLIEEYEDSFIKLGCNDRSSVCLSREKMEEEIEKLRCSENRLKSHIKALKRELVYLSEEKENQEHVQNKNYEELKKLNETLQHTIKKQKSKIQELMFENEELKISVTKRCEELVELSVICEELLKDFI